MSPTRRDIFKRLERLSDQLPEMRLCQLICNMASLVAGPWDVSLWDMEDEQLLEAIKQLEASLSDKLVGVS
jgi:hypothetical protein